MVLGEVIGDNELGVPPLQQYECLNDISDPKEWDGHTMSNGLVIAQQVVSQKME
jgi:hypothetical protein